MSMKRTCLAALRLGTIETDTDIEYDAECLVRFHYTIHAILSALVANARGYFTIDDVPMTFKIVSFLVQC